MCPTKNKNAQCARKSLCRDAHCAVSQDMKHAARIEAERRVAIAAANMRRAEMGTDESAYLAAESAWKARLVELTHAEITHPTQREIARRANIIRLENRGLVA